jgi:hypothetical protein
MIGVVALAICLVCPFVDMFDQWDHVLQNGNDSEYPLVILALCVGMAFALGRLIIRLSPIMPVSSMRYFLPSASNSLSFMLLPSAMVLASASPPLSLRI